MIQKSNVEMIWNGSKFISSFSFCIHVLSVRTPFAYKLNAPNSTPLPRLSQSFDRHWFSWMAMHQLRYHTKYALMQRRRWTKRFFLYFACQFLVDTSSNGPVFTWNKMRENSKFEEFLCCLLASLESESWLGAMLEWCKQIISKQFLFSNNPSNFEAGVSRNVSRMNRNVRCSKLYVSLGKDLSTDVVIKIDCSSGGICWVVNSKCSPRVKTPYVTRWGK